MEFSATSALTQQLYTVAIGVDRLIAPSLLLIPHYCNELLGTMFTLCPSCIQYTIEKVGSQRKVRTSDQSLTYHYDFHRNLLKSLFLLKVVPKMKVLNSLFFGL